MAFQVDRPQVTEIQVRMDCNGCVQKIRRSLQSVQGIYKVIEDFGQQKIIVVGWADPEKVMRAIKKTGKIAKLCSHHTPEEENPEPRADPAEASASSATTVTQDPAEQTNQAVTEENAASAAAPPAEETPPPPPAEECAPPPADAPPQETTDPSPPNEESSVPLPDPLETYYRTIDHNHPDGYHMTQEYPRDVDYTTRYHHNPDSLDAQRRYQRYMADQYYNGGYHTGNSRQLTAADSSRFATMFSDENPNACCIT
ncbi:hypothetical protein SUGI_0854880 [Cryptomeria japonica]|uniref:heavy metal-associated isoprenylated plant protein 35 n=1 Tax=Cryptomeria japonica TaxID=3369 RepID=UPI002414AD65|nr:heavy metal-associated isoprenylated plant protein 35 [Cryptomeria japonica]GLJ41298.1 hypothetical protein SUGI_0854880 [Cryptomeria japonica]